MGKKGLCLDADHAEGCAIPCLQVDDDIYWSGDPDYHYNEMVKLSDYPELAMDDSEHIADYEYQYQYCLNIGFNVNPHSSFLIPPLII